MKEINLKFDLSRARNAEHYQFHTDVLAAVNKAFAEAADRTRNDLFLYVAQTISTGRSSSVLQRATHTLYTGRSSSVLQRATKK